MSPLDWSDDVLWILLATAISGLLLGLRFRVPALGGAAALATAVNVVVAVTAGWHLGSVLFSILASLVTLSISYLIGLVVASSWSRRRARRPTDASPDG